jgi:hypothetical protein
VVRAGTARLEKVKTQWLARYNVSASDHLLWGYLKSKVYKSLL